MSEIPTPVEELSQDEVAGQQRELFRGLVDERVSDVPLPEDRAEYEIEQFGLPPGGYEVFGDTVPRFGGGFKKFVDKGESGEVLVGLTYATQGGLMTDINDSLYNMILRPNGDIVGRVTTENSGGVEVLDISWPADSEDEKSRGAHQRHLATMAKKAQAAVREDAEATERSQPSNSRDVDTTKPGRTGRFRSRFSRRSS